MFRRNKANFISIPILFQVGKGEMNDILRDKLDCGVVYRGNRPEKYVVKVIKVN